MRIAADIETDGLIDTVTEITSLCWVDLDTGDEVAYRPGQIEEGLRRVMDADECVMHNGIAYDIPVIKKLYPWFSPPKITDTLVLSRLAYPDLRDRDFARFGPKALRDKGGPKVFNGSHSLAAHGVRLGFRKLSYDGEWTDGWTPELETYCLQDCRVTAKLHHSLPLATMSLRAIDLEHRFARVCHDMEQRGFKFDTAHAQALMAALTQRQDEISTELQRTYGGWYEPDGPVVTPKRSVRYKARPEVSKDCPYQKVKFVIFNPNSRQHIERVLRVSGWEPKEFTESGTQAKIDETVLKSLADKIPEAGLMAEQFTIAKRIGLVESWLDADKDGRIHAQVISNSAQTSRTSSRNPNLQQVPSVFGAYGRECRQCFTASPGRVLLASDLDKAELMLLAHYMHPWDNGQYAAMLAEQDIHQLNADAMGIDRPTAKRVIFALVYGCSDKLLGEITGRNGSEVRADLMSAFPALQQLIDAIRTRVKKSGGFTALDGRFIPCPADFKSLNYLIQSSTSIVGKLWATQAVEKLRVANTPCDLVMYVHDELQFDCAPAHTGFATDVIKRSLSDACSFYNLNVTMTCDTQVGKDWSESH